MRTRKVTNDAHQCDSKNPIFSLDVLIRNPWSVHSSFFMLLLPWITRNRFNCFISRKSDSLFCKVEQHLGTDSVILQKLGHRKPYSKFMWREKESLLELYKIAYPGSMFHSILVSFVLVLETKWNSFGVVPNSKFETVFDSHIPDLLCHASSWSKRNPLILLKL